ncbi:S8 family serine peptidase [Reyranella soli]|uniref:Peptidase S8/S53 domain-containing protein n=1 Tax=Reyranella soli TaxID=1230389 RepID=A0A512NSZ5_9HYPH|nr:S8 family serine peptidase [Reyranella soli]GEP62074.1 hypothetical protein RSO01_92400 [Reyranella soli]
MAKATSLKVSVVPNEILFPRATVAVEAASAFDAEAAQGGIVVRGVRGKVALARAGRVASWSPEAESLPPGQHCLVVRGLVSRNGKSLPGDREIPFFVTDSVAKVPGRLRVESMVRLRVGALEAERLSIDRRPRGRYIEIMKASDRKSGAPTALAFDQSGRRVDAERLLRRLQAARAKKFGKLQESLHAHLAKAGTRGRVPVAIWLRSEETTANGEKKLRGETKRPAREVERQGREIGRVVAAFTTRCGDKWRGLERDPVAPVVYAELTRAEIAALAKDRAVAGVFLHEREGIEDLVNSIGIANSDDVHTQGFRGSGVKVAVWEDGPDVTTDLSITARFKSSGFATSDHARHTHGIVKNIERNAPHGHAPSCSLHSANTKDLDALRWAVKDKGCTVVSQSFHRSSEPGASGMSFDDIYKDWLALHWPWPTICQAAGNFFTGDPDNINPPSSEFVNHKGYNGLVVGNHDDTAGAMSGSSVFRNPASSHGDRELPEIAANGTSVTAVKLTKSGTSMASPAAAGVVALIQNHDATLKSWPEGCRAIMLAAAKRNIAGSTWWQDVVSSVDASDGTGATDALEASDITSQRRSRNAAGTRRGWDVGTLRSRDIGRDRRTTFSYNVTLPRFFLGPRKVKVALAWDSKITMFPFPGIELPIASVLGVDLDLQVFDRNGTQVGYSGSWDNSYEIAEFTGTPGETYTIKIRRWSGSDDVWYGIAWTVTGGLFWADATRATVLQQALENGGD